MSNHSSNRKILRAANKLLLFNQSRRNPAVVESKWEEDLVQTPSQKVKNGHTSECKQLWVDILFFSLSLSLGKRQPQKPEKGGFSLARRRGGWGYKFRLSLNALPRKDSREGAGSQPLLRFYVCRRTEPNPRAVPQSGVGRQRETQGSLWARERDRARRA